MGLLGLGFARIVYCMGRCSMGRPSECTGTSCTITSSHWLQQPGGQADGCIVCSACKHSDQGECEANKCRRSDAWLLLMLLHIDHQLQQRQLPHPQAQMGTRTASMPLMCLYRLCWCSVNPQKHGAAEQLVTDGRTQELWGWCVCCVCTALHQACESA